LVARGLDLPAVVLRHLDECLNIRLHTFFVPGILAKSRSVPDPSQIGTPTMERTRVEKVSKALADETRLTIFEAISGQDHMNCSEIVAVQGVTPATVSHHLKVLVEANLIECRREGQFVRSRVVPKTIKDYTQTLSRIAQGRKAAKKR
jgi:ArsR family transcriptional regulator, arsenate/arsenite/antimonite-responsive transcriptional repressor